MNDASSFCTGTAAPAFSSDMEPDGQVMVHKQWNL